MSNTQRNLVERTITILFLLFIIISLISSIFIYNFIDIKEYKDYSFSILNKNDKNIKGKNYNGYLMINNIDPPDTNIGLKYYFKENYTLSPEKDIIFNANYSYYNIYNEILYKDWNYMLIPYNDDVTFDITFKMKHINYYYITFIAILVISILYLIKRIINSNRSFNYVIPFLIKLWDLELIRTIFGLSILIGFIVVFFIGAHYSVNIKRLNTWYYINDYIKIPKYGENFYDEFKGYIKISETRNYDSNLYIKMYVEYDQDIDFNTITLNSTNDTYKFELQFDNIWYFKVFKDKDYHNLCEVKLSYFYYSYELIPLFIFLTLLVWSLLLLVLFFKEPENITRKWLYSISYVFIYFYKKIVKFIKYLIKLNKKRHTIKETNEVEIVNDDKEIKINYDYGSDISDDSENNENVNY